MKEQLVITASDNLVAISGESAYELRQLVDLS